MRIMVVAPSCPLRRDAAERVAAIAADRGDCELIVHPQCFEEDGHFAGSDAVRLAAVRDALAELDDTWDRQQQALRDLVPLVLHGASGVPDEVLQRAVRGGVAKINVNTELRAAFFGALAQALPGSTPGLDLPALLRPVVTAVRDVAVSKVEAVTRPLTDHRPARAL